MKRPILSAASLALVLAATSGCAAFQDERTEVGLTDTRDVEFETEVTTDESSPALLADADDTTTSAEGTAGVNDASGSPEDGFHEVRPISDVNPQWTTNPAAFDFRAPELFSGAPVSGSDLYASGPVLLTFVSPNCAVSIDEGSDFFDAADWNQDVTFVFVHTDGDEESFKQFVEDQDLFFQNVIHINGEDLMLWNRFGIETQPSSVLLNSQGEASLTSGGLGYEGLATAVALLGPSA